MPVKPILFSGPMVQALLAGRKTQTRRVINTKGGPNNIFGGAWTDDYVLNPENAVWREKQIPFAVGDLLWVRETWNVWQASRDGDEWWPTGTIPKEDPRDHPDARSAFAVDYPVASPNKGTDAGKGPWRPGIHMPRWASRLTLKVTDVRAQRLRDISDTDAAAEGVQADGEWPQKGAGRLENFEKLWNSLNEARGFGWDVNPWVAAYTFEVHHCNVDEFDRRAA
jgi:hypothetical protein